MNTKKTLLLFLSNFIIICFPIFILFVMGPSEIFFGNYKEFGFVYQEFGWKFLIFAFLISFLVYFFYFILSRQTQKIYSFCFLGNRNCRIYPDNVFKPSSGTNRCPCRSIHRITFKNNCKLDYLDNYHFGSFAVCKISTEYLQKSNVNILSHYSRDAMCWIHLTFPLRR